jgi:hypothetical protein
MIDPIDLATAAQSLKTHFGSPLAASRHGGEQQFTAVLHHQFGLTEPAAGSVVTALVRRQALRWVSAHGVAQPMSRCPRTMRAVADPTGSRARMVIGRAGR